MANYRIEKSGKVPAYRQLYEQLRQDIHTGVIAAGHKLPSKRTLAAEVGVSVITVEHTLALLADEGYIEARTRSGYYCVSASHAQTLPIKRASLASMTVADDIPADFPFSVLAKTMRRVLSEYDRRILSRGANTGCIELRCALSEYLFRSRGIKAAPEQIVIGSGAEYLYSLAVQLLGRERRIALESPCYDKIRRVYESSGAVCELLALGEDGIESSALAGSHAGVLHVTPYHSYPSGVTATAAKRQEYALWAKSRGAYIIEDDYDSESAPRPVETLFSIAPERVIYVNSFSKTIAPAIRTGYMLLPEALVGDYEKKLGFLACTVPVFEQLVLAQFIADGELERCIDRRRRQERQRAKQLSAEAGQ